MSDAFEIIIRYLITFACSWAVKHGYDQMFADQQFAGAVTTIVAGVLGVGAMMIRALYMSAVKRVLARLAARGDITQIQTTPALANSIPSDKVVSAGDATATGAQ